MFEQYRSLLKILGRYYKGYGGLRVFFASPLMHAATVFTIIFSVGGATMDWREAAAATLPTILGFSLAAYVLIFTLMGGELHTALSKIIESRRSVNYLALINSTFFHAIFIQVITYLFSVFSRGDLFTSMARGSYILGLPSLPADAAIVSITDAIGVFLTAYSLLLVVGVLIAVFRLASATQPPDQTESAQNENAAPEASTSDPPAPQP